METTLGISLLLGSLSQFFILIACVLAAVFLISKRKNLPPGPWGIIPYIGYAPNVAYAMYQGKALAKYLTTLGRRYGKFYSFTAFGIPVVVMNDYKLIREAFQDPKLNDRGENELQQKVFSRSYNRWHDMAPYRNFVLAAFHTFGIGTSRFEEPITKESTYLIEELVKLNGQPVDLKWYLNNAVSNIICQVVFGQRFEFTDEKMHRLTDLLVRQNELSGAGALEMFVPINIPSENKRQMIKGADELLEFINGMIENHRKNFDPNNLNDFIDMWLNEIRVKESDDPDCFCHPGNMPGQILLLFLAGTETTSNTIRWGTQFLVKHREIQDRIHHELDSVIGRNRLPTLVDKPNLPYVQAVLLELHRMISLTPLSGFHVAGETTSIRGYTVPKNSVVISNLYAVMHDPDVWGDPEVFRPERFLDNDGNLCELDEVIPFGVGRRVCLGEALAKQELFIFFSHLMHQFKFEKTSEDAPPPTLKPIEGAVIHAEAYKLRVIQRN